MVQIEGNYKYVKGEGVEEFFSALSPDPSIAKKFASSKPGIKISKAGDQWTITVVSEGKESSSSFKLGSPYDEQTPSFGVFKSVTTLDGDKFVTETETPTGDKFKRVYEFTPSGITVLLSSSKTALTSKRYYERA